MLFVGMTRQWTLSKPHAPKPHQHLTQPSLSDHDSSHRESARSTESKQLRETKWLEYDAYGAMALLEMQKLEEHALQTWNVRNIAMVHRLGRVEIGEISVAVAVGSPHREAAFAAAKWLIDELKRQVPIWKKECYSQGDAEWVEGSFAPSCSACHGTDDSA